MLISLSLYLSCTSSSHRTSAPLVYPPLILSLSAILTASLLCPRNVSASHAASARRIRRFFGLSTDDNPASEPVADDADPRKAQTMHDPRQGVKRNGKSAPEGTSIPDQARRWADDASWELNLRCFSEEIEGKCLQPCHICFDGSLTCTVLFVYRGHTLPFRPLPLILLSHNFCPVC